MIKRSIPALIDGIVVDTSDPQEMGRLKVWCPSIDGDNPNVETLPWATYMSPLAGQANDYPAGGSAGKAVGPVSYGIWAVPKVGARVIIGFLYDDYNQRVYIGSLFPLHGNRSLPNGRNASSQAPVSDTIETIEPMASNLKAQFQGDLANSIARTRGAYERQVAQAADVKSAEEGYSTRVVKAPEEKAGTLDPQTYCITTPGRHSIMMQDDPKFARLRVKTAEGHQIIFDDANERIYVSTAHGKTWLELDQDGHVHLYGAESISMSAGGDFNLQALGSVTIAAGKDVNIQAAGYARVSACKDVSLSGDGGMNLTSGGAFNILASGTMLQTASHIHLNGPKAPTAPCAVGPTIVPSHEPWNRPASKSKRGPNWKA
jgi:hypothetical protein